MDNERVMALWTELKEIVNAVELDVLKNVKGNSAAGVRSRKGLREMKKKLNELVKTTVERDKVKRAAKRAARAASKA